MMCKLKGQMDKGGHYDVEMKGWMQKGGHYYVQIKGGGWIREGIICGTDRVNAKVGHYGAN